MAPRRKTIKIRKTPQNVLLWPPVSWVRRSYLTSDGSGTCRGLITWPKQDVEWARFLTFVTRAVKQVHSSDEQWREACSKVGMLDMSRYADICLVRSWLIDMDQVQPALKRRPPPRALEEQIRDAVTDYL